MRDHKDDAQWAALKDKALYALGCAVITLAGLAIGLWCGRIEEDITKLRQRLDDRSSLPVRITELEKRTDDQEHRLRDVEIRLGSRR